MRPAITQLPVSESLCPTQTDKRSSDTNQHQNSLDRLRVQLKQSALCSSLDVCHLHVALHSGCSLLLLLLLLVGWSRRRVLFLLRWCCWCWCCFSWGQRKHVRVRMTDSLSQRLWINNWWSMVQLYLPSRPSPAACAAAVSAASSSSSQTEWCWLAGSTWYKTQSQTTCSVLTLPVRLQAHTVSWQLSLTFSSSGDGRWWDPGRPRRPRSDVSSSSLGSELAAAWKASYRVPAAWRQDEQTWRVDRRAVNTADTANSC